MKHTELMPLRLYDLTGDFLLMHRRELRAVLFTYPEPKGGTSFWDPFDYNQRDITDSITANEPLTKMVEGES